jgi:WD40 repeat protein
MRIRLLGQNDQTNAIAFTPSGQTLATPGVDSTIMVWDVSDPGKPYRLGNPTTGHLDSVSAVAFSPDGQTLVTASATAALLWDVTGLDDFGSDPLKLACSLTRRSLYPVEWANLIPDIPFKEVCAS